MGKGGQIWLKCITGDLIMIMTDKNNILERVENFHADLAWDYPSLLSIFICDCSAKKGKYKSHQLVVIEVISLLCKVPNRSSEKASKCHIAV